MTELVTIITEEQPKTLVEKIREAEPDYVDVSDDSFSPWSISKLKVLQQCPLRFYLQYILKIKVKAFTPSLVTNVGKAAHCILENLLMGKSLTDSYKIAKMKYVPDILSEAEWESEVITLEYSIGDFRAKMDAFEAKNPVKRFVQELKVGVTKDLKPTGFFGDDVYFRGVIDLGIQLESKDVVILDHKTGAPAKLGVRAFQTQLDTYKVLFHHGIEKVEGAQSGIHFIRDNKIVLDDYVEQKEIEGKLVQELRFYITGRIDFVKELGFFKHIRGAHCKWCDYDTECKKGNLIEIEKQTVRFFTKKEIEGA